MNPNYYSIVEARYKLVSFFKRYECTYCGRSAETVDHVPARIISYISRPSAPHLKVPCCRTCNSILGDRPLNTLTARCSFLEEKYKKRHKRDLALPDWDKYELEEMGPLAKIEIISALKQKESIEDILYHLVLAASFYDRIIEWNDSDFSDLEINEQG